MSAATTKRRGKQTARHADRGATGQAMISRAASMVVIEDDTATADGTRRFTRTEVLRVRDSIVDQYAAAGILTGPALDAAVELARLYEAGRNAPTGWRVSGGNGGGEMSDERADAWAAYCSALDAMPTRCQAACMDVARDVWPSDLRAVANLREGFGALANLWRMK
jgi:hypothetical protein